MFWITILNITSRFLEYANITSCLKERFVGSKNQKCFCNSVAWQLGSLLTLWCSYATNANFQVFPTLRSTVLLQLYGLSFRFDDNSWKGMMSFTLTCQAHRNTELSYLTPSILSPSPRFVLICHKLGSINHLTWYYLDHKSFIFCKGGRRDRGLKP